jgi:hypothetical protein
VHNFISKLIYTGEDMLNIRPPDEGVAVEAQRHLNENVLKHEDEVLAIKEAIKPGFFAMIC